MTTNNLTLVDRLKSRKLWITFAGIVVVGFGKALGLELSEEQLWSIAIIVAGYVGGQGVADAVQGHRP